MSNPNFRPQTQFIPQNSSMAITSLVMGILGWTLLPFIGTVVAIITGHIAKGEIKKSGGRLIGDGMATTGLVLGYAQVALSMCLCLVFLLFPALLAGLWNYGDSFIR